MRHLLALLDDGTPGTSAEPSQVPGRAPEKLVPDQRLEIVGTCGTRGTLEIVQADALEDIARRVADLAGVWNERMAICLEAGDVSEAEAHRIAEAEVGRRFVETFSLLTHSFSTSDTPPFFA